MKATFSIWYTEIMENVQPVSSAVGYRKLGKRTLWIMLSDQMVPSVIIFIAAVLLLIAQDK